MSTQPKTHLTPEEYLEIDSKAEFKSEFYRGKMHAMAGAGRAHNMLVSNLTREINQQTRSRPCEGYPTDMRVQVRAELYTYPDYVIVCGQPQFLGQREATLLNPTLIVEVLSPSPEAYDRGLKFEMYQSMASLREYLLIATERVRVDRYIRQPSDEWLLTSANKLEETIHLESIDCHLRLADLYEKVELTEPAAIPTG